MRGCRETKRGVGHWRKFCHETVNILAGGATNPQDWSSRFTLKEGLACVFTVQFVVVYRRWFLPPSRSLRLRDAVLNIPSSD